MTTDPNPARDGATTALQRKLTELEAQWKADVRRIEELTKERHELANAIADHWRPRVEDLESQLQDANCAEAEEIAQLKASLATERAAHEQAEKEAVKAQQDMLDGVTFWVEKHDAAVRDRNAQLERKLQADRERDTARALLERQGGSWLEVEALVNRLAAMQRERDTLQARVKELEADREAELQARVKFVDRAVAAETDLASARPGAGRCG